MKEALLSWIWCPKCHSSFSLSSEESASGEVLQGRLECKECSIGYPIRSGVPRFVENDIYTDSFSFQWQMWRSLQHFSISGIPVYEHRFLEATALREDDLRGKLVLDVGCGNGPYLDVVRRKGATVVGVDLSFAVDIAFQHYGRHPNVHIVQGDIFVLPFREMSFDVVFTLGVIQHTPAPERAMRTLPGLVKPGGLLVIGVYHASRFYRLKPKYILRLITSRLWPEYGRRFISRYVPFAQRVRALCHFIPGGRLLGKALPLAIPEERASLTEEQLREWIIMDTYDMLITRCDIPLRPSVVKRVFEEAGFVAVYRPSLKSNCFRGIRPS